MNCKFIWVVPLAIALAGCWDKEVSRAKVGGSEREVKGTQSCSGPSGYCYSCGMTIYGKFECSLQMRWTCPGTRPVTRKVWETVITYESGNKRVVTDSSVISVDGECK